MLGFTAAETAEVMATSTASVTSAIQRARASIGSGTRRSGVPNPHERAMAAEFAAALERGDVDAFVARLAADVTWAMPPMLAWYAGRDAVVAFARAVPFGGGCGTWRTRPTTVNALPAVSAWLDSGTGRFEAWSINAIDVRDGRIAAITTFQDPAHFTLFGLPDRL